MFRGGNIDLERKHSQILIASGEAEVWGWGTPAGKERVARRVNWIRSIMSQTNTPLTNLNLLECGCGTGIFTREVAKTGASITALDIAPDLLNIAREECRATNVTFIEANLEEPTALEKNKYFDMIYGISVLHHVDVVKALTALRAFIKPHGLFAFSEPNLNNPINKYLYFVDSSAQRKKYGISPSEMAFTAKELRDLFQEAGDILKIVYLSKRQQLPIAIITPSIMWERCLDLLTIASLTVLAIQFSPVPISPYFALASLLFLILAFYSARKFSSFFHAIYDKFPVRFATLLHTLHAHAIDKVLFRTLGVNIILSIGIWALHFATFVLCFSAVGGLDLALSSMLVVFVVTCLGTVLPSSPANLGLFEGAMVLSLSWYGIGHSEALGMALYIHALYFFPVTIIALWVGRNIPSQQ